MRMAFIILATTLLATTGQTDDTNSPAFQVRAVMKDVLAGKFRQGETGLVSGWIMTTEDGKQFHRATLQDQVVPLIAVGTEAVPELLKWLDHDEMHIRYIAHYSLDQITGEEPFFPHFATLEELRRKGWLKTAIAAWQDWYDSRKAKPNQVPEDTTRKLADPQH
jgi:hypothetical protein